MSTDKANAANAIRRHGQRFNTHFERLSSGEGDLLLTMIELEKYISSCRIAKSSGLSAQSYVKHTLPVLYHVHSILSVKSIRDQAPIPAELRALAAMGASQVPGCGKVPLYGSQYVKNSRWHRLINSIRKGI